MHTDDPDLLASLASANSGELSTRVPCTVTPFGVRARGDMIRTNTGIADMVAFWCPDCGEYKGFRVLVYYLVLDGEGTTKIRRPLLPLGEDDEWGRA